MALQLNSDDDYEREVLQSEQPVFVKFSAPWCGPCKTMAPIIASLAQDYEGEMKFVEVDIDALPGLTEKVGVRGVPTVLIVRKGEVVQREVGAQSRSRIAALIEAGIEGTAL